MHLLPFKICINKVSGKQAKNALPNNPALYKYKNKSASSEAQLLLIEMWIVYFHKDVVDWLFQHFYNICIKGFYMCIRVALNKVCVFIARDSILEVIIIPPAYEVCRGLYIELVRRLIHSSVRLSGCDSVC